MCDCDPLNSIYLDTIVNNSTDVDQTIPLILWHLPAVPPPISATNSTGPPVSPPHPHK